MPEPIPVGKLDASIRLRKKSACGSAIWSLRLGARSEDPEGATGRSGRVGKSLNESRVRSRTGRRETSGRGSFVRVVRVARALIAASSALLLSGCFFGTVGLAIGIVAASGGFDGSDDGPLLATGLARTTGASRETIGFTYGLESPSYPVSVLVEYSVPGSGTDEATFREATLEGDAENPILVGAEEEVGALGFRWKAQTDLAAQTVENVTVRVTPRVGDVVGTPDSVTIDRAGNVPAEPKDLSVVRDGDPGKASVRVALEVTDPDRDLVELLEVRLEVLPEVAASGFAPEPVPLTAAQVSGAGGEQVSGASFESFEASPDGSTYSIEIDLAALDPEAGSGLGWLARHDGSPDAFRGELSVTLAVRESSADAPTEWSSPTVPFTTNDSPVVEILEVGPGEPARSLIPVRFRLWDPQADLVRVRVLVQDGDGDDFEPALLYPALDLATGEPLPTDRPDGLREAGAPTPRVRTALWDPVAESFSPSRVRFRVEAEEVAPADGGEDPEAWRLTGQAESGWLDMGWPLRTRLAAEFANIEDASHIAMGSFLERVSGLDVREPFLVVAHAESSVLTVIRDFADPDAGRAVLALGQGIPTDLVGADLDGDGGSEVVAALPESRALVVLQFGRDGFRRTRVVPLGEFAPSRLVAFDLDDDGKTDLLAIDRDRHRVLAILATGQPDHPLVVPAEGSLPGTRLPGVPTALAAGDLDDDGLYEVVVISEDAGLLSVLTWAPVTGELVPPVGASAGMDMDLGDARRPVDVICVEVGQQSHVFVASRGSDDVAHLGLGLEAMDFSEPLEEFAAAELESEPVAVLAGDFDADGRQDVVAVGRDKDAQGPFSTFGLWRHGDLFSSRPAVAAVAGPDVSDALTVDVDLDGVAEILLASQLASQVTVQKFAFAGCADAGEDLAMPSEGPSVVVAGDFDGDGLVSALLADERGLRSVPLHLAPASAAAEEPIALGGARPVALVAWEPAGATRTHPAAVLVESSPGALRPLLHDPTRSSLVVGPGVELGFEPLAASRALLLDCDDSVDCDEAEDPDEVPGLLIVGEASEPEAEAPGRIAFAWTSDGGIPDRTPPAHAIEGVTAFDVGDVQGNGDDEVAFLVAEPEADLAAEIRILPLRALLEETLAPGTAWTVRLSADDPFFGSPAVAREARETTGLALADFDADGRLEIAVAFASPPGVCLVRPQGGEDAGTLLRTFPLEGPPEHVLAADFDGDAAPDLAVSLAGRREVRLLSGRRAEPYFVEVDRFPLFADPRALLTADANRDSLVDIIAVSVDPTGSSPLRWTRLLQYSTRPHVNLLLDPSSDRHWETLAGGLEVARLRGEHDAVGRYELRVPKRLLHGDSLQVCMVPGPVGVLAQAEAPGGRWLAITDVVTFLPGSGTFPKSEAIEDPISDDIPLDRLAVELECLVAPFPDQERVRARAIADPSDFREGLRVLHRGAADGRWTVYSPGDVDEADDADDSELLYIEIRSEGDWLQGTSVRFPVVPFGSYVVTYDDDGEEP